MPIAQSAVVCCMLISRLLQGGLHLADFGRALDPASEDHLHSLTTNL